MSSTRYLFRLDDITPTMNWAKFSSVMSLFEMYGIKPLLGVVPDNRDPVLDCEEPRANFWEEMRSFVSRGVAEIAQHGYQHTLKACPGVPLLGARFGFKERSEFAGDPYELQLEKIEAGRAILCRNGIDTTYWFAPSHAYDTNTSRALAACGFTAVSDGISLFPFEEHGLLFVPQQFAKPRWMPWGVITVCLHTNLITPRTFQEIKRFLERGPVCSSFSQEVQRYRKKRIQVWVNNSFRPLYEGTWRIKSGLARLVERDDSLTLSNRSP